MPFHLFFHQFQQANIAFRRATIQLYHNNDYANFHFWRPTKNEHVDGEGISHSNRRLYEKEENEN